MRKKQKKVVYLHKCKLYIAIQAYRKHKKIKSSMVAAYTGGLIK